MLAAAAPVVVASHELGHVVAGRLGGYYVAAMGMGGGHRFLRVPLGGRFNLFFGAVPLAGGATIVFPTRTPMGRRAAFGYHYGGIVAQLVLQGVAHLVYWQLPETRPFLWPGLALNASVLVANLIPFRTSIGPLPLESDGARASQSLRTPGGVSMEAFTGVEPGAFDVVESRLSTPTGRFVLAVCRAARFDDERSAAFLETAIPPAGTPRMYRKLFEDLRA